MTVSFASASFAALIRQHKICAAVIFDRLGLRTLRFVCLCRQQQCVSVVLFAQFDKKAGTSTAWPDAIADVAHSNFASRDGSNQENHGSVHPKLSSPRRGFRPTAKLCRAATGHDRRPCLFAKNVGIQDRRRTGKIICSNRIRAWSSLARAPVLLPANRDSISATTSSGGSLPSRVISRSDCSACSSVCCAEQPTVNNTENRRTEIPDVCKVLKHNE